jgi:hypothetical protein
MAREEAREQAKKLDTFYDKVFVKRVVKAIQDVDPGIGAVIFPTSTASENSVAQIIFYWKNIILHKIWLDEKNIASAEASIAEHQKTVRDRIRMIRLGMIDIRPLQKAVRGFNKKKTGKFL